jgi:hypothetical protein
MREAPDRAPLLLLLAELCRECPHVLLIGFLTARLFAVALLARDPRRLCRPNRVTHPSVSVESAICGESAEDGRVHNVCVIALAGTAGRVLRRHSDHVAFTGSIVRDLLTLR